MKKITYLLTAFFLVAFGWLGTAQIGGDDCANAEVITPGAFVGTTITDGTGGATQGDAADAKWFSYIPAADGTIDVSACLGGSDTRLWVWEGTCAAIISVADNDDACDLGDGNTWASEVTGIPVTAGTEYFIEWDDRWEDGVAFNWSLTYTPPPACAPPTDLAIIAIDSGLGTADFSWTDNNAPSNDFDYTVEDITNAVTFITSTTGGATSVQITGLVAGNDYTFTINADCGINGNSALVGPLAWNQTDLPDCISTPTPADGAVDVIAGLTQLTWVEAVTGGTPTGYEIFFGTTSGSIPSLGVLGAPSTGLGIGPTFPNTTYYWMLVPQNAGGSAIGCAEYSFTTKAAPNSPIVNVTCPGADNMNVFTEEFDAIGLWTGGVGTGGTNDLWNFAQSGGTGSSDTGPSAAHSGASYMYFEASGANFATAAAVTPAIDLTAATDGAELSFYMHAYGASMGTLNVGVGTSASGPFTNEFSWGGQIQTADTDPWTPIGVNLDAYVGQTIYIEVAYAKTNNFTGDMAIDLFNVETCLTVSCAAPNNLAVTNIDVVDVDIAWDVSPDETSGYDWEIQPAGNVQGDIGAIATGNAATNSVINVAGPYTPSASYTLFVSTNCGLGGNSSYNNTSFTIPFGGDDCANAEAITPGTFLATIINGGTAGASQGDAADAAWFSYTASGDGTIDVSACLGGADTRLWIWDGTCAALNAVADNDDACDLGNGSAFASEVTGVPVIGGTEYFIEWDDRWSEGPFDWSLTFTPAPSCLEPTNLMVTDINPANVDLSWDEEPGATDGYRWEIQDVGVAQGDAGVINSGYNSAGSLDITVTDATGPFTIGNSYTLYVNSVCTDGVDESTYASVDFTIPFNGNCGLFSSSPGVAIPDNDIITGVTDVITGDGPAGEVLTDLNVYVGITHTWTGDLDITLTSPSGTSVVIFNTCGNDDNLDVEFDDGAGVLVCATPGVYDPSNPLSAFNGETFVGDWSLTVTDSAGGDTGTLDQWCLIPTTGPDPACGGAVWTWDGATWDSLGSPGVTDVVIIDGAYSTGTDGNLDVCTIRINPTHSLVVGAGSFVQTQSNIEVGGNLVILHEGSLVQLDAAAATVKVGAGLIDVQKITPLLNQNAFSILGSPMTAETRADVYNAAVIVRNHVTGNFVPNPLVEAVSPGINNWADDNGNNWLTHTGQLVPGAGYLVKPQFTGPDAQYQTNYTMGTLNSGDITIATVFNTSQNDSPNILSNPYASAIDADLLIGANADMGGSLYFWEHITAQNAAYPGYQSANYDMGDISNYNLSGGNAAANGGVAPTQFAPSGQGFGIKVTVATPVTFTNAMRVTGPNTGYRNANAAIDRVYLQVKNDAYGLGSSALIAFTENATDGFDQNYDALRLGTSIAIYSMIDDSEFGIQGRSAFNEGQIVPLGFATLVDETQEYTISLSSIEGELISNATVFLKDNLLNTLTNLSETDYSFTANMGNQQGRFTMVFEYGVLGNQEVSLEAVSIYPVPTSSMLTINSPLAKVNTVVLHDISGRQVGFYNFTDQNSYQIDVSSLDTAIYFVEINTENGSVTKRIIKE